MNDFKNDTLTFPPVDSSSATDTDYAENTANPTPVGNNGREVNQPRIDRLMQNISYTDKFSDSYRTPNGSDLESYTATQLSRNEVDSFIAGEPPVFVGEYINNKDSSQKNMDFRGLIYLDSDGDASLINPENNSIFSSSGKFYNFMKWSIFMIILLGMIIVPFVVSTGS